MWCALMAIGAAAVYYGDGRLENGIFIELIKCGIK